MDITTIRVATRFLQALGIGDTWENDKWRIHEYAGSIKITELENAGRRGKKVRSLILYNFPPTFPTESVAAEFIIEAKKGVDFGKMQQVLEEQREIFDCKSDYQEYRGVDIMPAGFQPLRIRGDKVYVEADFNDFTVRDDDSANLSTCIPAITGGRKSIPAFYRWVKDNQGKIKNMSYTEVLHEMNALGIQYHTYCAMD